MKHKSKIFFYKNEFLTQKNIRDEELSYEGKNYNLQ